MQTYLLRLWHGLYQHATCRYCRAPIVWAQTDQGKAIPLNADYGVTDTIEDPVRRVRFDLVHRSCVHFGSCPNKPAPASRRREQRTGPRRKLLEVSEREGDA